MVEVIAKACYHGCMRHFVILLAIVSFGLADQVEITLKHVKASDIQFKMNQLLKVKIESDDFRGILRVWGTEEELVEARKVVSLFDVATKKIQLRFKVVKTVDKLDYEGTASVRNNRTFTFSDSDTRAKVAFLGRISPEDDKISCVVHIDIEGAVFEMNTKVKNGAQFLVEIPKMTPSNEKAQQALLNTDSRLWPIVSLTPVIIEPKK